MRKLNWKKAGKISLIVVGSLCAAAILLGVLNGLLADGTWTFGWTDYSYDDTGYQTGEGSVGTTSLTRIDLDWIDGTVRVVACDDTYISLTESAPTPLGEKSILRWHVSDDQKTLTVKYRSPSKFFGSGENKNKDLILRIPKKLFAQLQELKIHTASAQLELEGIHAEKLSLSTDSGSILLKDCTCKNLVSSGRNGSFTFDCDVGESAQIAVKKANVTLVLPKGSEFTLIPSISKSGSCTVDFPTTQTDGKYICGSGAVQITVSTVEGDITIQKSLTRE